MQAPAKLAEPDARGDVDEQGVLGSFCVLEDSLGVHAEVPLEDAMRYFLVGVWQLGNGTEGRWRTVRGEGETDLEQGFAFDDRDDIAVVEL